MKKMKIVVAGWNGQKYIGPFLEDGQAEEYCEELNALLKDKLDLAHVIEIGGERPTPAQVAEQLNEVTPVLPESDLWETDEETPVVEVNVVGDDTDDTQGGEG